MTLALLEKQLIIFKTDEIKLTAGFNKRAERVLEPLIKHGEYLVPNEMITKLAF